MKKAIYFLGVVAILILLIFHPCRYYYGGREIPSRSYAIWPDSVVARMDVGATLVYGVAIVGSTLLLSRAVRKN